MPRRPSAVPPVVTFGRPADAHPAVIGNGPSHWAPTPHALTALALTARSASPERVAQDVAVDAGGLVPDPAATNSWIDHVQRVDPVELLEVQLCNAVAPFILVSRLRPALAASDARRSYVVNVSAMEGQFSRGYKGPGHPHTNMAKAALNMLTRTSAREMLDTDGILMTAVDTGWITDERPHPTKMRLAGEGFHAPLTWSTAPPASTTRSRGARPARTWSAASSRTTAPRRGETVAQVAMKPWIRAVTPANWPGRSSQSSSARHSRGTAGAAAIRVGHRGF
jgi:NAD(P)-dependent dehydrogenase (short-subunit alcohol dehydrogenase family)